MPLTSITPDPKTLSLFIEAEYAVPVERLWEAYVDPRQFERFWGPEGWPATFTRHDVAVGGESHYYMTGPDGSRHHGWFRFLAVDPLKSFEVEDGFSNPDGSRNDSLPTARMIFRFEPSANGTRFPARPAQTERQPAGTGALRGRSFAPTLTTASTTAPATSPNRPSKHSIRWCSNTMPQP